MTEHNKKIYYDKRPGFVIKSGTPDASGKSVDFSIVTDLGQGFEYTQEGNKFDRCDKTSYELCGTDSQETEPAKIIRAVNGNIHIEALNGEVVIKAKSIRLVAQDGSGEVTITSAKHFAVNAPIQNFKGSMSNTVMSNSVSSGALSVDSRGEIQNSATSGSEDTEGSLLTQLLKISQKFKNWISKCTGG
jgi:hypothetical protein